MLLFRQRRVAMGQLVGLAEVAQFLGLASRGARRFAGGFAGPFTALEHVHWVALEPARIPPRQAAASAIVAN